MIRLIQLYRLFIVTQALVERGCRLIEARLAREDAEPVIRIAPPPAGVVTTYAYRRPPDGCVPVPVLCVARVQGARVEWISREVRQ
jgi:hypothetical protein